METSSDRISLEACEWLVRLQDHPSVPEGSAADAEELNQAFFAWLTSSMAHLQVFMETVEAYQLLGTLNPKRSQEIHNLLQTRAEVIQIYGRAERSAGAGTIDRSRQKPSEEPRSKRRYIGMAAGAMLVILSSILGWILYGSETYATTIGEQRIFNLDDGSVVVLNTNSRVKVDFSDRERNIKLLQGEALFTVERDARRPFVVSTGIAAVRAVGTQFNVRRRHDETEVSVVEGVVQVNARGAPAASPVREDASAAETRSSRVASTKPLTATRLVAGEEAQVLGGQVSKRTKPDVANTLSWRARRLVFTNASFDVVAAEFNRYNRTQVRVEGTAAEKKLTGIFDADRPRAFVLYATRDLSLLVETEGDDWVIRSR